MNEAVFISDLHLHPQMPEIMQRFRTFVGWADTHTQRLYILGDFFHVWPGDEALDAWSIEIRDLLAGLTATGIQVFFMPGNRDFLVGAGFMRPAGIELLEEPALITLGQDRVLLIHGDRYCTKDWGHQILRMLTRNRFFKTFFLRLPYRIRSTLVNRVRDYSQQQDRKSEDSMRIVAAPMLKQMRSFGANIVIHGHIHQPGVTLHQDGSRQVRQYVLSDWDVNPSVLCYNNASFSFFNFLGV